MPFFGAPPSDNHEEGRLEGQRMSILTSADRFRHEVEKLLTEEVDRLKEVISLGLLDNFEQYRHLAGKIAGLRVAMDFLKDAESRCNQQ